MTNSFAPSQVRAHNGVPTIFADGQPLAGLTATGVKFSDPVAVKNFVDGGTEILMIWIEIALHCWKGEGQYDWTYAEQKLKYFEEHGGDTKWLIRIRLGLTDGWFGRAYPDEVHSVHDNNKGGSTSVCVIHSGVWLQHVGQLLKEFVVWLQTTRWAHRIIGFMLNAGSTEEWLPFDNEDNFAGKYHLVITREFRQWLHSEYNDDAALQTAWKTTDTLETAGPPRGQMRRGSHIFGLWTLRDPATNRPAIDYYRYFNEALADALIELCKIAKEAASVPVICGGFHSYLWWETGVYSYIQEYGHGLIQKLKSSPWVDFVSDITSYDGRYPGGPSGYLGLPHSLNVSNKLHYTEVDIATHLNMKEEHKRRWEEATQEQKAEMRPGSGEPIFYGNEWIWNLGFCGRDEEESKAVLQREAAHNIITGTAFWWFDIKSYSYNSPAMVEELSRLHRIGKEAVNWDRSTCSEVAFVCSEDTPPFQSAMNGSLLRFEMEAFHPLLIDGCNKKWGLAGLPYDCYELHDLAHPNFPGEQYKLLIFVNCARVTPQAQAAIRRWQNNGRTLCWTFAAACLDDEHFAPDLGEDIIGMRLGAHRGRRLIHVEVQEDGHALTRGDSSLNFGTQGAVGPVFYVDDDQAQTLGTLRDGGEVAYALRAHENWNSVYLSMLNFGPQLLRNLAKFSGAHVWCESDDVVYANSSLLCLHTAGGGAKTLHLPRPARVTDLLHGNECAGIVDRIDVELPAYRTALWRLEYGV